MLLRGTDAGNRLRGWFGVDAGWERVPADPRRVYRNDLWFGAFLTAAALVGAELGRSIGYFSEHDQPTWLVYLLAASGAMPLAWRRRFPLTVFVVAYVHFLAVALTVPMVTQLLPLQIVYFVALYTAVGWARDRRAMLVVVSGAILAMLGWLAWQFAVGSGLEAQLDEISGGEGSPGLLNQVHAYVVYSFMLNIAYFAGAVAAGQHMWRNAQRRERLAHQAATIERQAGELRSQAVVAERLRIARELHDVVAHHVSVIGIHATAARRVLDRDPARAKTALATIERESREAVAQMHGLLGTLRDDPAESVTDDPGMSPTARQRWPEPGLADMPALAAAADDLDTTFSLVEEPPGASEAVPAPVGLSLYRTTQEALANVRRHSTAQSVAVTLRVVRAAQDRFEHGFAEVEVIDDGRPRHGTSGTGLGLLGIRERAATHRGVVEIGPRVTGGYRVRVRLPLPEGEDGL